MVVVFIVILLDEFGKLVDLLEIGVIIIPVWYGCTHWLGNLK